MTDRATSPTPTQALLDAAEVVALRDGVARLTFDAVAAEAGMSKGGVLHHCANKDQPIEAMVKRTGALGVECHA